jgi:hypothetical protein
MIKAIWVFIVSFGISCAIGAFLLGVYLTLRGQISFGPDEVFFCTPTHWAVIVLFLIIGALSLVIGFLVANLSLWLMRHIVLQKGDGRFAAVAGVTKTTLVKLSSVSALALLPIYIVAFGSRTCLSVSQVYYQPGTFFPAKAIEISDIRKVRARCTMGSRGGWNIGFEVVLNDGSSLDLATIGPWFSAWSERISYLLRTRPFDDSDIRPGCPIHLRELISP